MEVESRCSLSVASIVNLAWLIATANTDTRTLSDKYAMRTNLAQLVDVNGRAEMDAYFGRWRASANDAMRGEG